MNMPVSANEPISPAPAGVRPQPGSASNEGTTAPKTTTSYPSATTVAQQINRTRTPTRLKDS